MREVSANYGNSVDNNNSPDVRMMSAASNKKHNLVIQEDGSDYCDLEKMICYFKKLPCPLNSSPTRKLLTSGKCDPPAAG